MALDTHAKRMNHFLYHIMNMSHNQYIDMLMLQETKLDDSFPMAQFNVHGCVMHRLDYTPISSGIITNVRSDIPRKSVKLYMIILYYTFHFFGQKLTDVPICSTFLSSNL